MTALTQKQSLRQSLSPQQVIQANILQLNISILEKKILDELESNPLLEQSVAEEESVQEENSLDAEVEYDEDPDEYEPANIYDNNNIQDREIPVKDQLDFIESLVQQLDAYKFKNWERTIAEEILWNLYHIQEIEILMLNEKEESQQPFLLNPHHMLKDLL